MSDAPPGESEQQSNEDFDDWVMTMMDAAKTWRANGDLHHYTTIGGLLGILDTERLWGTHVAYLNDSVELEYGIAAMCDVLGTHAADLDSEEPEGSTVDPEHSDGGIVRAVGEFIRAHAPYLKLAAGTFVSCLSASADQLSQWRGYGQSGGYAIAFDRKMLDDVHRVAKDGTVLDAPEPVLVKVRYRSAFHDDIKQSAYQYVEDAMKFRNEGGDGEPIEAQQSLLQRVLQIAPQLKDKSFAEETEYRIITRGVEEFYTPSKMGLIPRVLVQFNPNAIKEIMVGPGEFSDLRKISLERYLDRNHTRYGHVEVTTSRVPYREL